jgi:hypothetical protein
MQSGLVTRSVCFGLAFAGKASAHSRVTLVWVSSLDNQRIFLPRAFSALGSTFFFS